jgi:hypothetical protein
MNYGAWVRLDARMAATCRRELNPANAWLLMKVRVIHRRHFMVSSSLVLVGRNLHVSLTLLAAMVVTMFMVVTRL